MSKKKLQQMGEMCGQGADPEFCEREGIQNFLTSKKKKNLFTCGGEGGGLKFLRGHNAHFKVNPVPPPPPPRPGHDPRLAWPLFPYF